MVQGKFSNDVFMGKVLIVLCDPAFLILVITFRDVHYQMPAYIRELFRPYITCR